MSYTINRHAQLLVDYMDKLADENGKSMRQFCQDIGFDAARVSSWRTAKEDPNIPSIIKLAECLRISLGQILLIAGYATSEELGGAKVPEPPAQPQVSVDDAIDRDDSLDLDQRRVLKEFTAFVRAGGEARVTVRNRRGKRG